MRRYGFERRGHDYGYHQRQKRSPESFSEEVKMKVVRLQEGRSVITGRAITQFHHVDGRIGNKKAVTSVENCLGVDIVAHGLLHFWQWDASGNEDEWNAYLGQYNNMSPLEKKLFKELKDDEEKSKYWRERYVDPVEIMVRKKPNVHYI